MIQQHRFPPTLLLASEPCSAGAARAFVRAYIGYRVPDVCEAHVDAVTLVTCELVTNAIRYGTGPEDAVRVVLDPGGGRTRVEVHDPVRRRPRLRPIAEHCERGRGLVILDALCAGAWGVRTLPRGKAVWAEVAA